MFRYMITLAAAWTASNTLITKTEAAVPEVSISVAEGHSAVFAGRLANFHFMIVAQGPFQGRVEWLLTVNNATASRGEIALEADTGSPQTIGIPLPMPKIRSGVVVPAELIVVAVADGHQQPLASLRKRLWLFPEDPFHGRSEWLEQLDIKLFDPQGKTRNVLRRAAVPFATVDNLDVLAELDGGLLIIGQGISFVDYPGLAKEMISAASRGTTVLCLAPAEGRFALPGTDRSNLPQPKWVAFSLSDVIHVLDKRLDSAAWPGNARVLASSLTVRADCDRAFGVVVPPEVGWAWLEVCFNPGSAKLLVCGFDLMGQWESGPTPRFLFVRLLEYLERENTSAATKGVVR